MAGQTPSDRGAFVLVVEDEESIRQGLCDVLAFHGHHPEGVASGDRGLERGLEGSFDLVLLDVMLPGRDGFEVCRELRRELPGLPILMLTAKGSEEDVVRGLRCGADDYVTKPFSIRELVARVEALLRRTATGAARQTFRFGPWEVEGEALRATDGKRMIELTPREAALLALFARERGRVLSRRTLLQEVWGFDHPEQIETRTVDVHIAKLRKKIRHGRRTLIETVRGAGYRAEL